MADDSKKNELHAEDRAKEEIPASNAFSWVLLGISFVLTLASLSSISSAWVEWRGFFVDFINIYEMFTQWILWPLFGWWPFQVPQDVYDAVTLFTLSMCALNLKRLMEKRTPYTTELFRTIVDHFKWEYQRKCDGRERRQVVFAGTALLDTLRLSYIWSVSLVLSTLMAILSPKLSIYVWYVFVRPDWPRAELIEKQLPGARKIQRATWVVLFAFVVLLFVNYQIGKAEASLPH